MNSNRGFMKKKYLIIVLIGVVALLIGVVGQLNKNHSSEKRQADSEKNIEDKVSKEKVSQDNTSYIGIYSYEESVDTCVNSLMLVLRKNYEAIFMLDNCSIKTFYMGKYYIEDKKINLYNVKMLDEVLHEEQDVLDSDIHFNIVNEDELTSIFGREKSVKLVKKINSY